MPQSNTPSDVDLGARLTSLVHQLRLCTERGDGTAVDPMLDKIRLLLDNVSTATFLRIRRQLRKNAQYIDDEAFLYDLANRPDDDDAPGPFGA